MADLNKAELRRLAEAAMAGDWFKAGDLLCFDVKTGESHGLNVEDDRFIAAATPVSVKYLLDECESLHSALGSPDEITAEPAGDYDALRKQFISLLMLANSKAKQAQHWRSQSGHAMHQTLVQTAANVNAERDTNAMLTDALMRAEAERDAALAELARLRALLLEASEEIAAWGAYASDYFQEKHGLEACVAKFHDAAMSQEANHA